MKFTVEVPAVKVLLLAQLPATLIVELLPKSVPAVRVTFPVKLCVSPAPKSSVPPVPLIVNPPPFTLPVNVAVPAVFVIETRPVVVKPAMLCEAIVLAMTIGEALAVKMPLLTKLPPKVN